MGNKKKLSKAEKLALREGIRRKLKEIKFNPNRRIKLPKETLEDILFDETKTSKYLGYYFEGLCKLDLSEISFDGVILSAPKMVDLSNTNVKIDFRTVKRSQYQNDRIIINHIDLTNVDLSNSHLVETDICDFSHSSFKNTNLNLTAARIYQFYKCDLSGLDLSSTTLYSMAWKYDYHDGNIPETLKNKDKKHLLSIRDCNLSNTWAIIKATPDNPSDAFVINKFSEEKSRKQVGKLIAKGYLKNCIIADKTIEPIYSEKELLDMKKNDTKTRDRIADTLDSIDEQITGIKKEKPERTDMVLKFSNTTKFIK